MKPTVQAYPGHVDPTKVTTELPPFVNTMQKHGLRVRQIRGGNQTAVDAPNVEALVGTMGQLGVTHYWLGTDNYDLTKPIMPQLDAIKLKVEQFVKLNQKHGTTLMYHTRAGASSVGSVVWDLLYVMKDFDPKYVGLPLGHRAHGASRRQHVGAAHAHGRSVRRRHGLEGPRVGAESRVSRRGRTVSGAAGAAAAAAGGVAPVVVAARGGGRGAGAPELAQEPAARRRLAGAEPAADPGAAGAPVGRVAVRRPATWRRRPARAGRRPAGRGRGGRGRGGSRRSSRCRSPATRSRAAADGPRPRCRWARASSTSSATPRCCATSGSTGRWSSKAEYPLGGAQSGADKLTLPREMVLGNLKRDVLTIRAALQQSGTGLTI